MSESFSGWVPMAWPETWTGTGALSLLEGSPVNTLVIPAKAADTQALISEAKKRKLNLVARLDSDDQAPFDGADAVWLSPRSQRKLPLPSIGSNSDAAIALVPQALWPRVPSKRETSGAPDAGPTGMPWVDANGWRVQLARVRHPGKPVWLASSAPQDSIVRPEAFQLAVADAAAYGASWVVSLPEPVASGLLNADAEGKQCWDLICSAQRFLAERRSWADSAVIARLGVVSDFAGPIEAIAGETLNLISRRMVPYRILLSPNLNESSLKGLDGVLWLQLKPPDEAQNAALSSWVRSGGLLIAPPSAAALADNGTDPKDWDNRYRVVHQGQGRVAVSRVPWTDPYQLSADTHLILGRRFDILRSWNSGSTAMHFTGDDKRATVQVVNYTARPMSDPVSIFVARPYRSAQLYRLTNKDPESIQVHQRDGGTEVFLPPFATYSALELRS